MSRREWLLIILLWTFATSFNLAKPFHIDDPQFLDTAQWIAQHPLHPMQGPFNGLGFMGRIADLDNPHLIPYVMAAWGAIFGYSEIAMHVLQSLFVFVDFCLFYLLARMLARPVAWLLTALFALSPGLVVGQNMMLDPALIAFWMGFFYCLLRAHAANFEAKWLVRAGLFASAAVLTKYSGVVLLAITLIDGLLNRRLRIWIAAAIPSAALLLWSLFNLYDYGGVHLLGRARHLVGPGEFLEFTDAWVLTIGALVPFSLSLLSPYLQLRWRTAARAAAFLPLLALICLAIVVVVAPDWESPVNRLLTTAALANALLLFTLAAGAFTRVQPPSAVPSFAQPRFLLLLWMVGASAFYLLFAVSVASRHVLLALIPLLLLIGSGIPVGISRSAAAAGLVTTALLSASLAVSDWDFADFYRSAASNIANQYRGRNLWFTAHWAWQYYARSDGLKQLDVFHPPLRPGDLIAMPGGITPDRLAFSGELREIDLLKRETGPWNLFCTAAPSRFYALSTAATPWLITNRCTSAIQVMEVESLGVN
jgi:4-amino-4-deoxy-L-arabinose transferase-like glycosyltransferase